MKPRLLDLFCGAGGAAMGYHRAGFEVIGVDIEPQPNYPFDWAETDALEALRSGRVPCGHFFGEPFDWDVAGFDAIHASPPCQAHVKGLAGVNRSLGRDLGHVDLIGATRELLEQTGLPYVIENVEGAPLRNPVRLCGSSFRRPLRRHRLFETTFSVMVPPCNHSWQNEAKYWTSWRPSGEVRKSKVVQVYGNGGDSSEWAGAMGIDWMTRSEMAEAIPPIFTEHIGHYLLTHLRAQEKAAA